MYNIFVQITLVFFFCKMAAEEGKTEVKTKKSNVIIIRCLPCLHLCTYKKCKKKILKNGQWAETYFFDDKVCSSSLPSQEGE